MARIGLHYLPGDSILHCWDARCKFISLLMVTATLIQPSLFCFLFDSFLLLVLFPLSGLPVRLFVKDLRFWALLLLGLFFFQIFLTPGVRLPFIHWLPVSREGLLLGGWTFWRLGLMMGYAFLFTAVTRPRDFGEVMVWILKPVPFLPARRIGLMVSLALRFFSRILDRAEEVKAAHQARLGDRTFNPLRQAKFLVLPVLRNSILEVEEVTFALMARGFQDHQSSRLPKIRFLDFLPILVMLGVMLVFIWIT